jgi:hypothetical protein
MAAEWRNNAEPIDGEYIVDVDPEDGSAVQTFRGATIREVTDKLATAQVHASRRINELKKAELPDPAPKRATLAPRKLTADESFQAVQDLRDPLKLPEVFDSVFEKRFGARPEEVARRLNEADEKEEAAAAIAETKLFLESTPEWDPTPENKLKLASYMRDTGMAWTAKNFRIAFEKLMGDGLLTPMPTQHNAASETTAPERIVPQQTTRPRGSFSTGVRSSDVSRMPPSQPKQRYTRQDIDLMPKETYLWKINNEAGFAKLVDALG